MTKGKPNKRAPQVFPRMYEIVYAPSCWALDIKVCEWMSKNEPDNFHQPTGAPFVVDGWWYQALTWWCE